MVPCSRSKQIAINFVMENFNTNEMLTLSTVGLGRVHCTVEVAAAALAGRLLFTKSTGRL